MSNFGTDPFGMRFFQRNRPEEEEEGSSVGPTNSTINVCYWQIPGCFVPPPVYFVQTTNIISPSYYPPFFIQNNYMAPAAVVSSIQSPSDHECLTCTRNNTCDECKEEESTIQPTFWNPRPN